MEGHEHPLLGVSHSRSPKNEEESTGKAEFIAVNAKEFEEDIEWPSLEKYEEDRRKALLREQASETGDFEAGFVQELDTVLSQANDVEEPFVEVAERSRGLVCCMVNDINNGIHPNAVATKYSVSGLVLVRMLARFAQLKVFEITPEAEIPELLD